MSINLSPKNRVYIRLNSLEELKSPEICVSLDSNDHKNGFQTNDDLINKNIKRREECNLCLIMRQIILSKDIIIKELSEDRDQLKTKLTIINNQNIQLSQRLKRNDSQKQEFIKSHENSDQLIEMKAKCDELEAINEHLRQHLNTLRNVFNELHNSSESTTNQTTNTNNSTINSSEISNTLVNEMTNTLTETNITTSNSSNNIIIAKNDSLDNESSTQTSKSSFDKWYDK